MSSERRHQTGISGERKANNVFADQHGRAAEGRAIRNMEVELVP